MRKDVFSFVGEKYGHLTILEPVGVNENGETLVYCECDCENHYNKVVPLYKLLSGIAKSCGKSYHRYKSDCDYENRKFGRLTVVNIAYRRNRKIFLKCKCLCGNTTIASLNNLKSGSVKSCGCLRIENNEKHGMCNTKLYRVWNTMKQRCNNPRDLEYKNYGGRGIKVCEEWENDFRSFYDWSVKNGYVSCDTKSDISIDRIDVNADYSPDNCRFVTMHIQSRNKRNNIWIEYDGKRKILMDWSISTGIKYSTLLGRYYKGDRGEYLFREPHRGVYMRKRREE